MLTVERLTMKYESRGIENISFSASPGDVIGIVGPNGVGKSTLLKCIAGIIEPDRGKIAWNGSSIQYPAQDLIGYMPEYPAVPSYFTPKQSLLYLMLMNKVPDAEKKLPDILETFQIRSFCDKKNSELSQGMRKRVMMAIAFLNDPEIILLDEPTNGLDTEGLILLKAKIRECGAKGKIVLISSHVLDFVNAVNGKTLFLKGNQYLMTKSGGTDLEEQYLTYFGLR